MTRKSAESASVSAFKWLIHPLPVDRSSKENRADVRKNTVQNKDEEKGRPGCMCTEGSDAKLNTMHERDS